MGTIKKFPTPGVKERLAQGREALGGLVTSRTVPNVVAIGALLLLAAVSFLLWLEMRKRFPAIEPASYFGTIDGVFAGADTAPTRLYIERQSGGEDIVVVVVRAGWVPQVVSAVARNGRSGASDWIMPLTVSGPDGTLSLIGTRSGPGEYVGGVVNVDTGKEGQWRITTISRESTASVGDPVDTKLWLSLKHELSEIEDQIRETERKIPAQKNEIDKLTGFINEGERLKSSADEKFIQVKDQLKEVQSELNRAQEEARKLDAQLELAQRFTGMGRLVSLSRETLERDGRWLDSMLRGDVVSSETEVDRAVARAEAIVRTKRQIERLQRSRQSAGAPTEETTR